MNDDEEPPEVTSVLAVEYMDVHSATQALIMHDIANVLNKYGLVPQVHYYLTSGSPVDMLRIGRPVTDKPSNSQVGYLRRLYGDLERLMLHCTGRDVDPGVLEVAQMVKETVVEEMRDSADVSKRRMSDMIDAMKLSVADIQAELSGI